MTADQALLYAYEVLASGGPAGYAVTITDDPTFIGICYGGNVRRIELSRHFLTDDAEARDTVLHEIAHARVSEVYGDDEEDSHGPLWAENILPAEVHLVAERRNLHQLDPFRHTEPPMRMPRRENCSMMDEEEFDPDTEELLDAANRPDASPASIRDALRKYRAAQQEFRFDIVASHTPSRTTKVH